MHSALSAFWIFILLPERNCANEGPLQQMKMKMKMMKMKKMKKMMMMMMMMMMQRDNNKYIWTQVTPYLSCDIGIR